MLLQTMELMCVNVMNTYTFYAFMVRKLNKITKNVKFVAFKMPSALLVSQYENLIAISCVNSIS